MLCLWSLLRPLRLKSFAKKSAPRLRLIPETVEPMGMCARQAQLAYLGCVRGNLTVQMDALKVVLVSVVVLLTVVMATVDLVPLFVPLVLVLLPAHVQMAFVAALL